MKSPVFVLHALESGYEHALLLSVHATIGGAKYRAAQRAEKTLQWHTIGPDKLLGYPLDGTISIDGMYIIQETELMK